MIQLNICIPRKILYFWGSGRISWIDTNYTILAEARKSDVYISFASPLWLFWPKSQELGRKIVRKNARKNYTAVRTFSDHARALLDTRTFEILISHGIFLGAHARVRWKVAAKKIWAIENVVDRISTRILRRSNLRRSCNLFLTHCAPMSSVTRHRLYSQVCFSVAIFFKHNTLLCCYTALYKLTSILQSAFRIEQF